jgi:hypothetical protein
MGIFSSQLIFQDMKAQGEIGTTRFYQMMLHRSAI